MSAKESVVAAGLLLGAVALAPVPATAVTCDFTTTGSSCIIDGAIYQKMGQQPTRSDPLSFVRATTVTRSGLSRM